MCNLEIPKSKLGLYDVNLYSKRMTMIVSKLLAILLPSRNSDAKQTGKNCIRS